MHLTVDLEFSSLLLVLVCLVFPVIGFAARRQWRNSVARKEEINRLLIIASEEAARAELEAALSYSAVPTAGSNYQCAVCYCPATTRCARCKAVRYCSGKCQIVHWRQGHKEECSPASITYRGKDHCSSSVQKVTKEHQHGIYDDRHDNTSAREPVLYSPIDSDGVPFVKHDNDKTDFVSDIEGTNPFSESSATSFSGFSTPPTGGELLDYVSAGQNVSSDEPDASDSKMPAEIPPEMHKSGSSKVDGAKPLSPKFAGLVDSVDSFDNLSKLNKIKLSNNGRKSQSVSYSSSSHTNSVIDESATTRPDKASSGFWGRTLDSFVSNGDVQDDYALFNSIEPANSKFSDSESMLSFKFNLSGEKAPFLHAQSSEFEDMVPDDALPSALRISRPVDRTASSENTGASKGRGSPSLNSEMPNHVYSASIGDSNISECHELKSASSSYSNSASATGSDVLGTCVAKVGRSPSARSEGSNLVENNFVSTSHTSKSRLSPGASQAHLASSVSGNSNSGVELGKVGNVETYVVTSSQTASCHPSSINGLKPSVWKVVDQFRGPKSGRHGDMGLFPYDLFVKLYNSNKVEMRPCGLINCGNSCYANALLQCLAFTPPLTAYFVEGLHSKACVNKGWCFTCEFEILILKAKDGRHPLSPAGVLSQLQNKGGQLGNGREEDAHEFLRYAIDAMQSVCLKEAGVNGLGSFQEETTVIGFTFGGYLRSKIKCMKCQYKSERQERMMDLTVEIGGDIGKLEDALKRFTSTEILDGNNKYKCGRCKSYERAKKKLTILEAPNVLTIALKRFQSGKFGKLDKSIQFPEILDLAPYMSGTSDKSPIYRLYGVVVHLDVMNAAFSGHYVCYVKNIQNKWFKIDDSTVTAMELEKVLTKGAYMLLYARCSPRAPRLIRNRITSPDPKNKGTPARINIKKGRSNSISASTYLGSGKFPDSVPPDSLASVESFYLKFHRIQKILEEDSSSDNYSFTSSNSDEGSCSTDSNRDSTSTDDLSDYFFGGWNSSWRTTSGSDTSSSSSSSSLCSRHSPLPDVDHNVSGSPETCGSRVYGADSGMDDSLSLA